MCCENCRKARPFIIANGYSNWGWQPWIGWYNPWWGHGHWQHGWNGYGGWHHGWNNNHGSWHHRCRAHK